MRMSEIVEWNNCLELALRQRESSPAALVYWAGYQLGKLKPHIREFAESMRDPEIVEYENERSLIKTREEEIFCKKKNLSAYGKIEAINDEEKEVSIRKAPDSAFQEGTSISPIWGKAISFYVGDE